MLTEYQKGYYYTSSFESAKNQMRCVLGTILGIVTLGTTLGLYQGTSVKGINTRGADLLSICR